MTDPTANTPDAATGYLTGVKWHWWEVVAAFFAGAVASVAAAIVFYAVGVDPIEPLPFSIVFGAQSLVSLLVVAAFSRSRGTGSLAEDVGLVVDASDWWGVPAGMALQLAIALLTAPLIYLLWPEGPPTQGVADIASASRSIVDQIAVITSVAIAAPIVEEVIFRGMVLSILARSLRRWPAIIISAGIFAGVHLADPGAAAVVPGLFLLGVVLGWVALKRGNLSLPIALHSGLNLLAAIALLYSDPLLSWAEDQLEQIEGIIRLFG